MSLDNLVGISLEKVATDAASIVKLLDAATRNLVDANITEVSAENRFDAAYKAIMQSANAALQANGYRTLTNKPGHHVTMIQKIGVKYHIDCLRRIKYYSKGNIVPYLRNEAFRDWAYSQRVTHEANVSKQVVQLLRPSMKEIMKQVATKFKVSELSIRQSKRGRVKNNIPRWVAMYLSQEISSKKLNEIAKTFNLKRTGSIPTTISKLRVLMEEDLSLKRKVSHITRQYDT